MRKEKRTENDPIVIKKYANRRLYNTDASAYVTLDDLAQMVRSEKDFVVYDAKTGEDLTHSVLTQIIVEQESKGGQNLLPVPFLRQLIKFYGDNFGKFVPSYLEMSLSNFSKEQDKYRSQFENAFGGTPIDAMQEQARKNMAMFEQAMSMFSPFPNQENENQPQASAQQQQTEDDDNSVSDELKEMKAQLEAMQKKLDKLPE